MFSLTTSQVIFKGKLASTFTTEFPGSNFLLPTFSATFSVGSKRDFQVANLPLATVNFAPGYIEVMRLKFNKAGYEINSSKGQICHLKISFATS